MSDDRSLLQKLSAPLPLFDLFEYLRPLMQLTLDQYDLLQKALWRGYGVTGWDDLQRVCALVWVRPSYDDSQRKLFDREFIAYRERAVAALAPPEIEQLVKTDPLEIEKLSETSIDQPVLWPPLPQRSISAHHQNSLVQAATGVQIAPVEGRNWQFLPIDLPISVPQVRESWRALREVSRTGIADEVDVERTVVQIMRWGFLADVVLRPALRQRSELVVLVDEGDYMLPYFSALQPLFQAIAGGWVSPARIYRFTGYPARFLYDWQRPTHSVLADDVLARLHCWRTVVLVVSDGGAAVGGQNDDRVAGTRRFLQRWEPCVRQILWVNPVPEERWVGTSAAQIQQIMGGRMLWLENLRGQQVRMLLRGNS